MKPHLALFLVSLMNFQAAGALLDLAPYGVRSSWAGNHDAGLVWREVRDLHEVQVRFEGTAPEDLQLQYWAHTWPGPAPRANRIEDPADDPWQGQWLTAQTETERNEESCRFTFRPLSEQENPRAQNMPGVRYRRTLKVRVTSRTELPAIAELRAFSDAVATPMRVRIGLGYQEPKGVEWTGSIQVDNGRLDGVAPWGFEAGDHLSDGSHWSMTSSEAGKGLLLDLITAKPSLPGSFDCTLVTVRAHAAGEDRTFSFNVDDLRHGSIYVPAFHCWAMDASQGADFHAPSGKGPSIRTLIPTEPEQTFERASREIPPPDPWQNNKGNPIYMPLAADSSWQKFAFEYGGNVFIRKTETKAKGRERERLKWAGEQITWRIGTGSRRYYREDHKASVSLLDGDLPVITQTWDTDGLQYSEEAFATLLRGPLDPSDPGRSEQTPAVLMLRVTASNAGTADRIAHLWVDLKPDEELSLRGSSLAGAGHVRVVFDTERGPAPVLEDKAAHFAFIAPAHSQASVVLKLPFVSDLTAADAADLGQVKFDSERTRVIDYWKQLVAPLSGISTPERTLNLFARAVPWHIRMSTTKDPASGLYMVPAASYSYPVYPNEASFQVQLLDALGDHQTAAAYLETFLKLQGSVNFPGMHRGMEDAIFHGARVNADYDYTAHRYGLDHPTVLWTLGEHYLSSRDREWLRRVWPNMEKAIAWIQHQRGSTENRLLPACHLEDNADWASWFSINAFAWAGLDRAARSLEDIGHAEAPRLRHEADAFRVDLRAAVLRAAQEAPVTRLRNGTYTPYVPTEPNQRFRRFGPLGAAYYTRFGPLESPMMRLSATREVLYGPIILLNLGVFAPNEPLADWVLDDWEDNVTLTSGLGLNVHGLTDDRLWFSQGGMVFQCNLQNPVLVYLKRGETPAAIRGMYNNMVALFYPQANSLAEEFHEWGHGSGPLYKVPDEAKWVHRLRDALVLEDGDALLLARGVPRRWLQAKEGITARALPTCFGPVTYTLAAGAEPRTVVGQIEIPQRNPAKEVWLSARTSYGPIQAVTVNGEPWNALDSNHEAIRLPQGRGKLDVRIRY